MITGESDIIERYFAAHALTRGDIDVGIGDDGAVVRVPSDRRLVVATDTIISGVHFAADAAPADIGYRVLAVNLSDLAAMGAEPAWAVLALSLPAVEEQWLEEFARGFSGLARSAGVALIGGDLTRGELAATVTIHGFVPVDRHLSRGGAARGDVVYVTGTPGAAAAGLKLRQATDLVVPDVKSESLSEALLRPEPRIAAGRSLLSIASAAIDISDGLLIDVARLASASQVAVRIEPEALPLASAAAEIFGQSEAMRLALEGGDDYELCFTIAAAASSVLARASRTWDCRCTRIGQIEKGSGVYLGSDREAGPVRVFGHDHFAAGRSE